MGAILAIDTSDAIAGAAVYDECLLAEIVWRSGRRHSKTLLPSIDRVLELGGIGRSQLGAIALASGPGSYSGLRVGASTAIGLSLALDIRVLRVPTLEVLAYSAQPGAGSIRPAIDVGRGHYATARYVRGDASAEEVTGLVSVDFDGLVDLASAENSLLLGDFTSEERERSGTARLAPNAAGVRRAGFLAELAARRFGVEDYAEQGAAHLIYLNS